jgi:proteic killer suppression protein
MDVEFKDPALRRLETDADFSAGLSDALVRAYRKTVAHIRAASDERTFYTRRSFRFEKLKGDRAGQYSMRLNDQWRLILAINGESPQKNVLIIEVADYH